MLKLLLPLLLLRSSRIRLSTRAVLPNVDIESFNANILFRQTLSQ